MVSEVSDEKKVYCYLQNFDANQAILDPYEFKETSNENSDHISIINNNKSYTSSYYIPYLEKLQSTQSENELKSITKRTNDGGQLQKQYIMEQTYSQQKTVSESYYGKAIYNDSGKNNNYNSSYDYDINSSYDCHIVSKTPPLDTHIPELETDSSTPCENALNSIIPIYDYQIFPAESLAEPACDTNGVNPESDTCSVDRNSPDTYFF